MASTSRPNEALWREISQGLAAAGYSRNVAQCRSKWKALKQAFYSECHSPRVPPHYRTMKKIWKAAGRPVFGDRCLPGTAPPRLRGHVIHTRPPSALGQSTKSEPVSHKYRSARQPPGKRSQALWSVRTGNGNLGACLAQDSGSGFNSCHGRGVPDADCSLCCSQRRAPVRSPPLPTLDAPPAFAAFPRMKQESVDREAGPSVVSLLQSMQQLLVQILRTSQQQQVLLESLASDTLSHLISENVVQVGKTLHELLLQAHARSTDLPTPLSRYAPPPPVPRSPCSPNPPPNSHDHKEEPVVSSASGFHPHQLPPPPREPLQRLGAHSKGLPAPFVNMYSGGGVLIF
ncbi:unnamed protein product [Caretta caretta]